MNFLKKYRMLAFAFAAFIAFAGMLSSFDYLMPKKSICVETDENGVEHFKEFIAGPQQQRYALDTLTGTTTTTIVTPWVMASNYQYSYYFKMRKLTGPTATKIVLDASTSSSGGLWHPIDSVTMGGTDSLKMHFVLRGTAYDARHRLRFVRTGGAGHVARNIELNIKPL